MFRITRAVNYLEKKGICNNKINVDNIYFGDDEPLLLPKLGLPECSGKNFVFYKSGF